MDSLGHHKSDYHLRRCSSEVAPSFLERLLLAAVFLSALDALLMNLSRYAFCLIAAIFGSKVIHDSGVYGSEEDVWIAMLCCACCEALDICGPCWMKCEVMFCWPGVHPGWLVESAL